jgi:serralysin
MCWACAVTEPLKNIGEAMQSHAIAPPAITLAAGIASVATQYYWGTSTITYSIATSGSPWAGYGAGTAYDEPFKAQYSTFSAQQAAQFRLAIAEWDELIAPSFLETSGATNTGNIRIAFTDVGAGTAAYAYYPPYQGSVSASLSSGDVWFAHTNNTSTMAVGSFDFHTLLHELGHALGLKHSFETPNALPANLDNYRYSIMSYTSNLDSTTITFSGTPGAITGELSSVTLITPSLFDIAALQSRYGADPTTRSGATTYTWSAALASIEVVYDAGGIDTWDLSAQTRMSIVDLREGAYSSINSFSSAEQIAAAVATYGEGNRGFIESYVNSFSTGTLFEWKDNVGIAYGTVIENVLFGSANDTGLGNAAANLLNGGAGNDTLTGAGGNDAILGGAGIDTAILSGSRSSYGIAKNAGILYTADLRSGSPDGTDQNQSVERIQFADVTLSAEAFTPVNFNGDLNSDILWCNGSGLAVNFLMNGTGLIGAGAIGAANGAAWRVNAVGDLNGDGTSDLIWQDTSGLVVAYLMNGTSIASAVVVGNMTAAFRVVGSGDLNGDGQSDIVVQNGSGQAIGLLMSGSTIIGSGAIGAANGAAWSVAAVGDLNGDGRADLVWEHTDGSTVGYIMNGLAVTSAGQIAGANGTAFSVRGIGDLNGDGRGDIVWQFSNGQAGAWLMNGMAITGGGMIGGANGSTVEIRDIADLNGDGLMDLVWQNTSNGQAIGFLMNGTSIVSAATIGAANGADWFIV